MKRKSLFTKFDDKEKFINIVLSSNSISDILRAYALKTTSTYHIKKIKEYCNLYNVQIPVYNCTQSILKLQLLNRITNVDLFVANSTVASSVVRKRIKKENLIPYQCAICNIKNEWNFKILTLQLDHINGVRTDHRLENLRWLCPNCHSQTETYANKKRNSTSKGQKEKKYNITPGWNRGLEMINSRKVERPSKEELGKLLWEKPSTEIGIQFGVSDKSVENWAKQYALSKPPRGYWTKKRHRKI